MLRQRNSSHYWRVKLIGPGAGQVGVAEPELRSLPSFILEANGSELGVDFEIILLSFMQYFLIQTTMASSTLVYSTA